MPTCRLKTNKASKIPYKTKNQLLKAGFSLLYSLINTLVGYQPKAFAVYVQYFYFFVGF